jgi:hypothetical protein
VTADLRSEPDSMQREGASRRRAAAAGAEPSHEEALCKEKQEIG